MARIAILQACRRCIEDAQSCLKPDRDVQCALEVLDDCRRCDIGTSAFVPQAHRRGISTRTLYWSGAHDEPTRADLLAVERPIRALADRCRVSIRNVTPGQPIEIGFVPSGAARSAFVTDSVGSEGECLASALRGHVQLPAFHADHAVVVRFPLNHANWHEAPNPATSPAPADTSVSNDASASSQPDESE